MLYIPQPLTTYAKYLMFSMSLQSAILVKAYAHEILSTPIW